MGSPAWQGDTPTPAGELERAGPFCHRVRAVCQYLLMQLPSDDERGARRCLATRADGEPCGAFATRTGFCAGHSGVGLARNPSAAGEKCAEARRENRAERRVHAERRRMTLVEALAERAAEKRDVLVDAMFAAVEDEKLPTMQRQAAARVVIERLLGRPSEPLVNEASEHEEVPLETLVALWGAEVRGRPPADTDSKAQG
jgi:hypothetical protein